MPEHPFARFLRLLGKGKQTSRSLTMEEAEQAMTMILEGEVEDIQLGAFLLLLRVKGETPEELAGFARAAVNSMDAPRINVDIDWPSYAGKRKQLPWFLLAARALADSGCKIFMHGCSGHTADRVYTDNFLDVMGIITCHNWEEVGKSLDNHHFAYMPLETFSPTLARLFSLRALLGVRSPAHSFIKMLNPLNATLVLQPVFHPAYLEVHQKASRLLGLEHTLILKGEGGEFEFRPEADNRIYQLDGNEPSTSIWARRQPDKQPPLALEEIDADKLLNFWRGSYQDEYGEQAVTGTIAMLLSAQDRSLGQEEAGKVAGKLWRSRNTSLG